VSATRRAWRDLEARVAGEPDAGSFAPEDLADLPEPARRHLTAAIQPGTPLAPAARLTMRGRIKLGRWLPFSAHQLLVPRHGTVWAARVGGVIVGSDRAVGHEGGMDWRLLGLVPVMRASGRDVARSAAERAAGESIWVPTALARPRGARWSSAGDHEACAELRAGRRHVAVHHVLDDDGLLRSSSFLRWGDPDRTGTWALHPFGMEVTARRTFDGVTIASEGRAGWHHGTERWDEGAFFRFEITGYEVVGG
jgi:hypothetical protein